MGPVLETCHSTTTTNDNHNHKRILHEISEHYHINHFQEPSMRVPEYRDFQFTQLADYLISKNIKFVDQVYGNEKLLSYSNIKWKRLCQVYPQAAIHQQHSFDFKYLEQSLKSPFIHKNFIEAIEHLKDCPQLIEKIFGNLKISQAGFYVLYLNIQGNFDEPFKVIVDDFIPVNDKGEYLFGRPNNNLVWMIILEKVWAKTLKSYRNIEYIPAKKLFEQSTGIPLLQSYRPNYYLDSLQISFNKLSSKYLKFTVFKQTQILLVIWQPLNQLISQQSNRYNSFIMQLIKQQNDKNVLEYELYEGAYKMKENKCILMNNKKQNNKIFVVLAPGQYMLHIFNREENDLDTNLIVYASQRVDLHHRIQKQFRIKKHIMIKNYYKKQHNNLKVTHQSNQITVRFCWSNHRGILCLKNSSHDPNNRKQIIVTILPKYRNEIFMEDSDMHEKIRLVDSGEHCFFVFIRKRDMQIGQFYQIDSKNIIPT